jgi:hypothetical protein
MCCQACSYLIYSTYNLVNPLIKACLEKNIWRSEGKQVIMYLDDGLGIAEDDELCKAVVNQVKCDLINSGIVPKVEKSL